MRQNRLSIAKPQRAFTLIELLVTVSMVAILAAIAIPNLRDFVVGNRLSSNVNSFIGMLSYARSEAIIRNQQVIVCARQTNSNACATDDEWGKYETQIFVDGDGDNAYSTAAPPPGVEPDILLRRIAAVDLSGTQFNFKRDSAANEIKFQSGGFGSNTHRFDINVKDVDTAYEIKYGRTVCISRPGRTRIVGLVNVCPPN